jgi:hypothetical protein
VYQPQALQQQQQQHEEQQKQEQEHVPCFGHLKSQRSYLPLLLLLPQGGETLYGLLVPVQCQALRLPEQMQHQQRQHEQHLLGCCCCKWAAWVVPVARGPLELPAAVAAA